jgi:imidazolonepropionase
MDRVIAGGIVATMTPGGERYGRVGNGAVAVRDGTIRWVGPREALPEAFAGLPVSDFADRLVTPGLVDCHTHVVYGGHRAAEFEMRLEGATYEEVARAGGGILSTMRATRAADEASLLSAALSRVDRMLAAGVTTLEVKSGYGLTVADEMKMLRVARRIGEERPVRVVTSWLAAHAVPPDTDRETYLRDVVIGGLDAAKAEGLVDQVDGFCEGIAFSAAEMERVFEHAAGLGLPVKLHAEQLSHAGGTALAARHGALSADHLEHIVEDDAKALARAGSVAVVLPGAFYTLRETRAPDIAALRAYGVPIAVATDCNPGSSPLFSLPLALNMACTLFRLTPEEALAGATRNAARALGLGDTVGVLAPGYAADIAVWDVAEPAELAYRIGYDALAARFVGGRQA